MKNNRAARAAVRATEMLMPMPTFALVERPDDTDADVDDVLGRMDEVVAAGDVSVMVVVRAEVVKDIVVEELLLAEEEVG